MSTGDFDPRKFARPERDSPEYFRPLPLGVIDPKSAALKVKLLDKHAKPPTKATEGSACVDFYATQRVRLDHQCVSRVPLGVAVSFSPHYVLFMFIRSGLASRGLMLANGVGVIDSDYRGELQALVTPADPGWNGTYIEPGERVCQGLLVQKPGLEICIVDELDETDRGEGGFGHTGR